MPKLPKIRTKNSGIIVLESFRDERGGGRLTVAESDGSDSFSLPIVGKGERFQVRRVFVITGVEDANVKRANHAHRRTSEAIFCVQGSCTVHLDDGAERQKVILDDPTIGIITGPDLWHMITNLSPDSVILACADGPYDAKEYIHDYEEFLGGIKR